MFITTGTPNPIFRQNLTTAAPVKEAKTEAETQDGTELGQGHPILALIPNAKELLATAAPQNLSPQNLPIQELEKLIGQALSDPEVEKQLIGYMQELNNSGQLKPTLAHFAELAAQSGALPELPEGKKEQLIEQFAGMVDAEFRARGMTDDTKGVVYKDWQTLSKEHLSAIRQTSTAPRVPGGLSALTEPAFVKELEALQQAPFRAGNAVEVYTDGPASFAKRDEMIQNATESIHFMSWSFYDDQTGWDTARALVAKAQEGLDVKVLVDEQVGSRIGHRDTLAFMEENGVEVGRWRDSERPYDGQHRKMMVVDGKEMLAGGTNIGDVYSHRHGEVHWRDNDVHVEGPAAVDGTRLFAKLWNKQAEIKGWSKLDVPAEPVDGVSGAKTAVVSHQPDGLGGDPVFLSQLKAIEGATESVDIENAYFIETPALKEVLMSALDRGVRVRLVTNSAESIDEPVITAPILSSLPDLIEAGAEVYLKKGDTLHSKALIVDGLYSSVGSYNFHPRSHRYEGEMTVSSLDSNVAGTMTSKFEEGLQDTTRIWSKDQLEIPQSTFTTLATRFFFDQL